MATTAKPCSDWPWPTGPSASGPSLLWPCSYCGAAEQRRSTLPELCSPVVDALCPLVAADPEGGVGEVLALEAQPAVLALVDVCCSEEGLELAKGALAAAVEALPPAARLGLVSFGSQAGARGWGGYREWWRWVGVYVASPGLHGIRQRDALCFRKLLVLSFQHACHQFCPYRPL